MSLLNMLALPLPLVVSAFAWWVHGWAWAFAMIFAFVLANIAVNYVAVLNVGRIGVDRIDRTVLALKWMLFAIFMIGIYVSGPGTAPAS